jgi:osmotically-inducible protein OsmY
MQASLRKQEVPMQTLERHGHAGWQPKDTEIEHGIKNALARHPQIKLHELKIYVKDSDVKISGKAGSQSDIEEAGAIAANVFGVRRFENNLSLN